MVCMTVWAMLSTGCVKKMILDGTIESTRTASSAFDAVGDYELARAGAASGIVQFEGMHRLSPDNTDALFLLTKAWTGHGFAFAQDDMEAAQDAGDDAAAEYHRKRAKVAFDQAIFYGLELLSKKDEGFKAAAKNEDALRAWLRANFTDKTDAENLFWTGYAWVAKTNLLRDEPAAVAELFVGVALVARSAELYPEYMHYSSSLVLAGYHARAVMAEMDEAKRMFEMLLKQTQRKSLLVQLTYAQTYACVKADRPLYEKLLNEVLAADDPDPDQRFNNTLAKRRAKRWLGKQRMMDCGIDMSPPAPPPPPPKATSAAPAGKAK
jgi:hypothetical protein